MIRNPELLQALDDELIRRRPVDWRENLAVVEEMRQQAIRLGVWPPADPLAGLECDIRWAKVINHGRDTPRQTRAGA